jgi:hypothetical protein
MHIHDDRGSVKSDQIYPSEQLTPMMLPGGLSMKNSLIRNQRAGSTLSNLPLLPKAREDAMMGRTSSVPDNVIMQEERLRQ